MPDIEDRRVGTGSAVIATQDEFPASFPFARWGYQSAQYVKYWNAFTGAWLQEETTEVDEHNNPILRFPLQINYVKTACMKHSYILFGEVPNSNGSLAPIRISPRRVPGKKDLDDDARDRADELASFLERVYADNDARPLFRNQALVQQPLGGAVFRITWHPEDESLEFGIRVEQVLPDFFLPVWDTDRPSKLLEAWVVYRLPAREAAARFNYDLSSGSGDPLYIEHWREDKVTITLGGKPLEYTVKGEVFNFDDATNIWGEIPFFYIPRERSGGFYGLSLIDDVLEEAKEMNTRLADVSDVIGETSHRDIYGTNINMTPTPMDAGGTRPIINLGQTPPGGEEPKVFAIDPPSVNEAMVKYIEYLRDQFGRDVFVPSVAEGEDEGSQRSGLTLAFRMHPITSKLGAVRDYWAAGMIQMGKFIAKIAIMKNVGGITAKHLENIDWSVDWAPMIPRDREVELNEAVLGIQTNMLTPKEGNEKLSLTADPSRTEKYVMEWMQFMSALQVAAAAQDGTKPPKTQTKTQPVSTITKEPGEG